MLILSDEVMVSCIDFYSIYIDEEFATPLSSPPCEVESTDGDSAPSLSRPVGGAEVAAAIENMSSSLPSAVVRDTTR